MAAPVCGRRADPITVQSTLIESDAGRNRILLHGPRSQHPIGPEPRDGTTRMQKT